MAKNNNVLNFLTPARWWGEKWREGLFLGNGKTGANVYGGATDERILVNDASLYWLGRTTVVPDISEKTDEVRSRIAEGEFLKAQTVLTDALKEKNFHPKAEYPLPLCVMELHFSHGQTTKDFARRLDLEKGVATVSYAVGNTTYTRDMFVSREDNTIVYRLSKQGGGTITFDFVCTLMHELNARTHDGVCSMPEGVSCVYDKQFVCFAARNDDTGADYGIVAKIAPLGGTARAESDKLTIHNAQQVLITAKTFTSGAREKEWANLKNVLAANKDGYEKQLKAHVALHSKLFNTCSVSLTDEPDKHIEDLLLQADSGNLTPQLVEKIYKFSRYLLISGATSDGKSFAPAGLWNGSYMPYRSFRTYGGEFQMTYLFTLQGNMSQDLDKLFDYFEYNLGDYKINAQRIFGCRGAAIPVVEAPRTGRLGTTDTFGVYFSGCAAWVCNFFYKYARYNQNTRFLKSRLIPFMKEVALFYTDFFQHTENGLEIIPSALPMRLADAEKITDRPVVAKNSALDFALAKDLLRNLVTSCEELNVKYNPKWKELLEQIPSQQTASDGSFKEFVNSIISVDYTGVSNGTLYDAFFGNDVSWLSPEEKVDCYLATADKKRSAPSLQNSFNMTTLGAVYARLGLGNKAKECLTNAVRGCAINNLVLLDKDWRGMGVCGSGVWTPVQLHSNMVFANDVQQMLLYSHDDVIAVFPALPDDWKRISFVDMVAENGVVVSASLDAKGIFKVKLSAKRETAVNLFLPSFAKKLVKASGDVTPDGTNFDLIVPANKSVELTYKTNVK